MNIGRKIYFSRDSGVIVWDKGEMSGEVTPTTFEQDCEVMPILTLINSNGMLGVLQLNFGDYAEQFASCKGFIINPVTEQPQFVY